MKTAQTKYARHDPLHCLTPCLFKSLPTRQREGIRLSARHSFGSVCVEFMGNQALGHSDLRLLQGLVALAGRDGKEICAQPETHLGASLRNLMDLRDDVADKTAIGMANLSYSGIIQEIGLKPNQRSVRIIKDSLKRMSRVAIVLTHNELKTSESFRLLSYIDPAEGESLAIALNPTIARAMMGGRHVLIDMNHVRELKRVPTILIHQRLCGFIDPGRTKAVAMETLCNYAWPDPTGKASTLSMRRAAVYRALKELRGIGWKVSEYRAERFQIGRPAMHPWPEPGKSMIQETMRIR